MSTTSVGRARGAAPRRPARHGSAQLPRTALAPARGAARLPFALLVLLLLAAGLLTLLLLNTVTAQDAFVLYRLQQQSATLADTEQQLQEDVTRSEAPAVLASRAAELGMVPGGDPLFLRLPDGAVLGDPKAARGSGAPRVLVPPLASRTPTPSPTTTPTAATTPGPGTAAPSPSPSATATRPSTSPRLSTSPRPWTSTRPSTVTGPSSRIRGSASARPRVTAPSAVPTTTTTGRPR